MPAMVRWPAWFKPGSEINETFSRRRLDADPAGRRRRTEHQQPLMAPLAPSTTATGTASPIRRRCAATSGECIGRDAHPALARAVAGKTLTPQLRGHLIFFALPLGAKRALDYAAFFERRAPRLAAMKRQQAELFGACHAALAIEAKAEAAMRFEDLAALEPEIKAAILAA